MVEQLNSTFNSNIVLIFLTLLGVYFILIRWWMKSTFDQIIHKPKLTKKEKDAVLKERLDLIFSGINKQTLGRFWRWLLCKCYSKEQQGKYFKLYAAYNCVYLIYTICCIVLWFAALFILKLRWWSSLSIVLKTLLLDFPTLFICALANIFSISSQSTGSDRRTSRKLGWLFIVLLYLLLCLKIWLAMH